MSGYEARIRTLFGGGALVSDGGSPFYAKGAPIDNPFYPFYDKSSNAILLLTPDSNPSTMELLVSSLKTALSQVFMGKTPLPGIRKWSSLAYSPFDRRFHKLDELDDSQKLPGIVFVGKAELGASMASHQDAINEVLALTHGTVALSLIGCSPSIERTA